MDSGVNSAVADYRVEVRGRVEVRMGVMVRMKVDSRGYVNLIVGFRIRIVIWVRARVMVRLDS